ncbi:MAG: Probable epoxide hydrolase [uncultured Acidimicrobiales bacterium]|uniref:Probable epoxide hydrolase n=1 Tax=uncultured Acidimicrobiales bacterium TaxID=310071 RepID=A0A6J4HTJ6_9ACTN|nr:MAG: Probable epoxide hydrolase [uncultured Acidimicrobiales bacterium]
MITWDEWASAATPLAMDGLSVATYDLGPADGPTITFCHGYPSSSLDIAPVVDLLAGWRTITLDFPGFGGSDKPAGHPYSIHAAADAVERLWAERNVTETVLVAHDYGVSVGQELLARRAEARLSVEVTAAVWMNGGLWPDLHRPTRGQQLLLDPEGGAAFAATIDERRFVSGIEGTWGTRRPTDPDELHEMWRSMDRLGGVALMHELLHYVHDRRTHEARWRAALESSDVPASFVWGDLDPVSGAHVVGRIEERLPQARLIRLADVGHWPLLEAPDVVAGAIRSA